MKTRLTAIFLLATMLATASCGGSGAAEDTTASGDTPDTTTAEAVEVDYYSTLPDTTYGGKEYRMIGVDYATRRNFPNDEETGDVVNDALYDRNRLIEEKYEVKIVSTAKADQASLTTTVQNSITAGEQEFDILITTISGSLETLMRGDMLYDLRQIPSLKLDADWWSVGMYENNVIGGKQYITMGDISPMKFYAPFCLACNQRLAEDYQLGDLYTLVDEGKWTFDRFDEIVRELSRDLNGDTAFTVDDFYGYAYIDSSITYNAHYTAMGQKLSDIDSKGNISVNIGSEASIDIINEIKSLFETIPAVSSPDQITLFKEGRALFIGNSYATIAANMRDMEDDFGVIPTPKLDENQESYHSYINTWVLGGVAIPKNVADADMVGHISEALCYASYELVRPALYETTIKEKVSRDEMSKKMLDLIFDTTYLDMNGMANLGKSANIIYNVISKGAELVSSIASVKDAIAADIEKLGQLGE